VPLLVQEAIMRPIDRKMTNIALRFIENSQAGNSIQEHF
jgi:hypothetical protein